MRNNPHGWSLERAAEHLGWTVEQVRKRIDWKGRADLHLVAAKGEPHDRYQVRFVTRSSVMRVARLLAGGDA
jgi:hypothetical protein